MKKFISVIVVLCFGITNLMAQRTYVDNGGTYSKLNQQVDLKRNTFNFDLGVGNALDVGFHIQHNFNKYITWDILSARYGFKFNDRYNEFMATMGVRFNTPTFGKHKNMKVYLALGIGYGGFDHKFEEYHYYYYNGWTYSIYEDVTEWKSCVLPEVELGIYLSQHFYIGGHVSFFVNEYNCYMARLGYEF